jgi:hypothetical protein
MTIEGYLKFEHVLSLPNSFFPFPLATALKIGIVSTNRRSVANSIRFALRIQDMNIHNANSVGADVFIS